MKSPAISSENRQEILNDLLDTAMKDSDVQETLRILGISQSQYNRAINAKRTVTFSVSTTANPGGNHNERTTSS